MSRKKTARRKPRGRPFVKGQSGNPHGVPAWYAELRALAGSHAPAAIARLVQLMQQKKHLNVAKAAADSLLDRAGLKPFATEPDKLDVTTHDAGDAIGALSALVARRLAASGAGSGTPEPQPPTG